MPALRQFGTIFNTIREVDLTPIREEAERQTWIAILGHTDGSARDLATALYLAPRSLPPTDASRAMAGPLLLSMAKPELAERADLVVLVLDPDDSLSELARAEFQKWQTAGKKTIVLKNEAPSPAALVPSVEWAGARVLAGLVIQREFLEKEFVPTVLQLLPERKLSLARNYPLFRDAVAREVINETAVANASYSFSTGLAEIIPVLDVPFNVADMFVLTKAQAFMVYRLGLIFGLSTNWREHLAAFGSTIGMGFVWRTLARQLVGLIPVVGMLPKVAIAYAGTYALGRGALQWYETGRDVTRADLEQFFREALERGRSLGAGLAARAPRVSPPRFSRPRLPFGRKARALELSPGPSPASTAPTTPDR